MREVTGDNPISNAPSLPKHLIYTGKTSIRHITIHCSHSQTCQKKRFVIPWSVCVDAWKWAKINKFEMCKKLEDGVEEYWIYYSREVIKTDSLESSKIDRIMRKIKTNTLIPYVAVSKSNLPRVGIGGSATLCGAGGCEEDRKLDGRRFKACGFQEQDLGQAEYGYQ